jgi:selenocysteine lyase/cysteine desulfurase
MHEPAHERVHVKLRQVQHVPGLRVSPHIYTLKEELDRFVAALAQVVAAEASPS